MSGLNPCDHDLLQPATKRPGCIAVNEIYEFKCRDSQEMHTMTKVIQTFHENIKCGPKYVCTCCDQLWYPSSVTGNVKMTNTLNVPKLCLKHVLLLLPIEVG